MNQTLFTILIATTLLTGCGDTGPSDGYDETGEATSTDSESTDSTESGSESSGESTETGDSGDGDGDGDGDGETGTAFDPVQPYYPCEPMVMQAGDNYCMDGPQVITNPDSPIVPYTCVYGAVSSGPGQPEAGGYYCLPLQDAVNDGTGHKNGCVGEEHVGCLNLACADADELPMGWCENDPEAGDPWPPEGWDAQCCTLYCDTDADCGDFSMQCSSGIAGQGRCVKKD